MRTGDEARGSRQSVSICFKLQSEVQDAVSRKKEMESDCDDSECSTTKNSKGKHEVVLQVNGAPLHYTRKVGDVMNNIFSRKFRHDNVYKEAVLFRRIGSSDGDLIFNVNYNGHGDIPARHPWRRNKMCRIPCLSGTKKVHVIVIELNRKERSRLDRPEKNCEVYRKMLVNNFSNICELVTNLFPSTFVTAKASLRLPRHPRLVGCKVVADCFATSMEKLAETFARQVL